MFGLRSEGSKYPTVHPRVSSRNQAHHKKTSSSSKEPETSLETFEPAIDGPPSPERIRTYTEQMKRSSIFGNNTRTYTLSSATSSLRSRNSSTTSSEGISLSRRSSLRSNASSMAPRERPDSLQIFGRNLFSRKTRQRNGSLLSSSSSFTLSGDTSEDGSTREDDGRDSRRGSPSRESPKRKISEPYNFQHVTHTRQEQFPNLQCTPRMELLSEFSALRASQAPVHGGLKGIRARDLHLKHFSDGAMNALSKAGCAARLQYGPQHHGNTTRQSPSPTSYHLQPPRVVNRSKPHDLQFSPTRQLPSPPVSPRCPIEPPARTSSRSASVTYGGAFGHLMTTSLERPHTNAGFRRPAPFALAQQSAGPPPNWTEPDPSVSHAVTTPGDEAWPLPASIPAISGPDLADVPEEDDSIAARRRSRMSTTSSELRSCKSVPSLRLRAQEHNYERPGTAMSHTLGRTLPNVTGSTERAPSPTFHMNRDSWEEDIDYCYEHEVEADFDYQWERRSLDLGSREFMPSRPFQPSMDRCLEKDGASAYRVCFQESLLVPSASDLPELSPVSVTSLVNEPETDPVTPLRVSHIRSPSYASSFKESHGFNLSPTLLIPGDFASHMEEDDLYEDYPTHTPSATIFTPESYDRPVSPLEEALSSTASYRSSNFSGGSARSTSTALSIANSPLSQDSLMLLGQCGALTSVSSATSLPDLIPSTLRKPEIPPRNACRVTPATARLSESLDNVATTERFSKSQVNLTPSPGHRRTKAVVLEPLIRKGINHFAPPALTITRDDDPISSVIRENSGKGKEERYHGRNISAPVEATKTAEKQKGRPRASTLAAPGVASSKRRTSYSLFPPTA